MHIEFERWVDGSRLMSLIDDGNEQHGDPYEDSYGGCARLWNARCCQSVRQTRVGLADRVRIERDGGWVNLP